MSCFYGILATQTLELFSRKKSKLIFLYKGIIYYHSSSPSIKWVWITKELEPLSAFSYWWFNGFEITIYKIIEMSPFKIRCLKKHFPIIWDVVTFVFLAKIPRQFVRKDWSEVKLLCFFINSSIETPIAITRKIPKFDEIIVATFKKLSKFTRNSSKISLI